MNIHTIRENESIKDICVLYSALEKELVRINHLGDCFCEGKNIVIPLKGRYYFKNNKQSIYDVLSLFNIEEEKLLRENHEIIKFKNGYERYYIKNSLRTKEVNITSLIDTNLGINFFIEACMESEYTNTLLVSGAKYNDKDELYIDDYYLNKACEINKYKKNVIIGDVYAPPSLNIKKLVSLDFTHLNQDNLTFAYDFTNLSKEEITLFLKLLESLKEKGICIYLFTCEEIFDFLKVNSVFFTKLDEIISKYYFVLGGINSKEASSLSSYKNYFSEVLEYIDSKKISCGINLNATIIKSPKGVYGFDKNKGLPYTKENGSSLYFEDCYSIFKKLEFIKSLGIYDILIYTLSNRFISFEYIIKDIYGY